LFGPPDALSTAQSGRTRAEAIAIYERTGETLRYVALKGSSPMNSPDERALIERVSPYRYTQQGLELRQKAEESLTPLFAQFMDRGFSPYQINAVIYDAVADTCRDIVGIHKTAGKEAADKMLKDKLKP
jgi:hypothetical protein